MKRALILAAAAAMCVVASVPARAGHAVTVYGLLDGNRVIAFSADRPDRVLADAVIPIAAGSELVGIDRRPADAAIYGVARRPDGTAALYTIDPVGGTAGFVAALTAAPTTTNPGGEQIVLSGTRFGFDFNPAADALRIISDSGQNLRVIPSARTIAGVAVPAGATFVDGFLNRAGQPATGVTAAAYINNDTNPATGTALYDLDTNLDQLVLQNPPNSGTLVPVGDLSRDTTSVSGFDIVTVGDDGTTGGDTGYAAITQEHGRPITRLVLVDLASGRTSNLGALSASYSPLTGIAL